MDVMVHTNSGGQGRRLDDHVTRTKKTHHVF
jgi:hypothetical protein